jgi:putative hydrolase of the HAD superfamily
MHKTNTIIFDFGGVLVNLNTNACVDAFARLGYRLGDAAIEWIDHYKQKGLFLAFEEGKITVADFFTQLQQMTQQTVSIDELQQAYLCFLEDVAAYKLELILRLRQKYKILLLSKINQFIFSYSKQNYFSSDGRCFEDYFDKAYLSFKIGSCKPDKAIFEYMIADAALTPPDCLFLDDSVANIETANTMGFQTYCVKPHENFSAVFDSLLV